MNKNEFKIILITLILAALSACGAPDNNPEFDAYQDEFAADAKARGLSVQRVSISFEEGLAARGRCFYRFENYIQINPNAWASDNHTYMVEIEKKELIYHELGHCTLNLEHTERGIMASDISTRNAYWLYGETMLQRVDELFNLVSENKNHDQGTDE